MGSSSATATILGRSQEFIKRIRLTWLGSRIGVFKYMDRIRPRGRVEVKCSHPSCKWSFWIDALDPRLPRGPFDCGADHETEARVNAVLKRLGEAGLVCQVASGPGCSPSLGHEPPSVGYLMLRMNAEVGRKETWESGRFTWVVWHSINELEALSSDPNAYSWLSLAEARAQRPKGFRGL